MARSSSVAFQVISFVYILTPLHPKYLSHPSGRETRCNQPITKTFLREFCVQFPKACSKGSARESTAPAEGTHEHGCPFLANIHGDPTIQKFLMTRGTQVRPPGTDVLRVRAHFRLRDPRSRSGSQSASRKLRCLQPPGSGQLWMPYYLQSPARHRVRWAGGCSYVLTRRTDAGHDDHSNRGRAAVYRAASTGSRLKV